jgi:hypothetical protein
MKLLVVCMLAAVTATAQQPAAPTREELMRQITALKQQVPALEEKVNALPASSAQPVPDAAAPAEVAPTVDSKSAEPFAFADWTWLNGNPRTKTPAFDSKFFTPEIRADVAYIYDFNHPADDTIGGSSEVFRHNEFQLTHLGLGGDFHHDNVRARVMTQLGMYSQTQPRNDASPARGQWDLANAYRYISEAYNPGDPFKAWDTSATFDYMPSEYITFRWEYDHRQASVPYFTGRGGITPSGENQGMPGSLVAGFTPDLRRVENRLNMALMVKF